MEEENSLSTPFDQFDNQISFQSNKYSTQSIDPTNKYNISLKNQIKQLQKEKQDLQLQLNKYKEDNQKLRQELDRTSKENVLLRNQAVDLARKATAADIAYNNQSEVELSSRLQDPQEQISELKEIIQSLQKQKNKLSKKNQSQQQLIDNMKNECEELKREKSKLALSNQSNLDDIEQFKVELDACKSSCYEYESKLKSLNILNKKSTMSLDLLQKTYEKQLKEIESYNNERQNFNELLKKLSYLLTTTTTKYEDLIQEVEELKKSHGKQLLFHDLTDITSIVIPFKGEIGNRCSSILKLEQYEPFQRIQLIINEVNKEIAQFQEKEENYSQQIKHLKEEQLSTNQRKDLLDSLLKGLKGLADTEKQFDSSAFCEEDRAFMNFVALHVNDFQELTRPENNVFPNDTFLAASNENRKKILENLKTTDRSALDLINSLFLFNTQLVEQNRKMYTNLIRKKELTKLARKVGAENYNEICPKVDELLQQLQDLQKYKQMNQDIPVQIPLNADSDEINEKIHQLQEIIANLKNDNQALRNAARENVIQNRSIPLDEIGKMNSQKQNLLNENNNLQNQIRDKDEELEQLKEQLKENEETILNLTFQINQLSNSRSSLDSRIKDYLKKIASLEEKILEIQKKAKKKIKTLNREHEDEKTKLSNSYEEAKLLYEQSMKSMKEKMNQMRELSRQISANQAKGEQRNQQLEEENLTLQTKIQELTNQLSELSDQVRSEKQRAEERATAKIISIENQLQDEFSALKAKIVAQDHRLRSMFVNSIGSRYGINDPNISFENFELLIEKVQKDLKKLQIFQNNSTAPEQIAFDS